MKREFIRPKPLMFATPMAFSIDHLYFKHTENKHDEYYNPLKKKTLLGFVIPDFQRDLVWAKDQQVSLVRSVWMNIPIGTYSVNFKINNESLKPEARNLLIDGQQRLNALRAYWDDEFEFEGFKWSEISEIDQRFFLRASFPEMRTDSNDMDELRRYYNAMNFSGTAHKESERA